MTFDLAISLSGIYPKKMIIIASIKMATKMFITVVLITLKG